MTDTPMPRRCRWGFHKWSTWGPKFRIPDAVFHFEFQQKECLLCGHVRQRRIG